MNLQFKCIFYIIFNVIMTLCDKNVPVLLYSNFELNIQCSALNETYFQNLLKTASNIVILVEKKLSPEDFLSLKQLDLLENTYYCSSVTNELFSNVSLKYGQGNKFNITSKNIENFTKNVIPFVSYIYFQDEQEFLSRSEMISSHYVLMHKIYEMLSNSSKKIVIYSGLEPSWFSPGLRKKRNVNKTETKDLNTPKNVLLYLRNITLKIVPPTLNIKNEIELNNCQSPQLSGNQIKVTCSDRSISLNYTYTNSYWSIISINIPNNKFIERYVGDNFIFYPRDIGAVFGYSYHCLEINLAQSIPKSAHILLISIRKFQVQLLDESNKGQKKFDDAFDCAGWTTIPILTGLFVSFILLLIVGFGIIMLLDVRANDRFDDPKKGRSSSFLIRN